MASRKKMDTYLGGNVVLLSCFMADLMKWGCTDMSGSSSVGRASAFQAECREFEPRLPLQKFFEFYHGRINWENQKY